MRAVFCSSAVVLAVVGLGHSCASAATIFESAMLGPAGIPRGVVGSQMEPGINVSGAVYVGVRFEVVRPVVTTHVGGHFVGPFGDESTFFGAIVRLSDESDFPDSADLSTRDVLGAALLEFPNPSADVFGEISVRLEPGWHALVFGSGFLGEERFGARGKGGVLLNNFDIGSPSYLGYSNGFGWGNRLIDSGQRFVVRGAVVPEPSALACVVLGVSLILSCRRPFVPRAKYQRALC